MKFFSLLIVFSGIFFSPDVAGGILNSNIRNENIICRSGCNITIDTIALRGKKGACFTLRNPDDPRGGSYLENMPKVVALNPKWNYSWGSDLAPNQPDSIEFIPMQWGGFTPPPTTLYNKLQPLISSGRIRYLLGFNEPDKTDQSNLTVDSALSLWPYLGSLNIPLGSPAAANDFGTWFRQFMDSIKVKGYPIDFICYHSYGGINVSAFLNNVKLLHDTYQKPVLITEFAVADWSATSPAANKYTDLQVQTFMKQVLPALDTTSYVMGYAWFPFKRSSAAGTHSALFEDDGSLTTLGTIYANQKILFPSDRNLVLNGDFELGIFASVPFYWQGNAAHCSPENINCIEGDQSVMLTDPDSASFIQQTVKVIPGKSYIFSFRARIQDTQGPQGGANSNHILYGKVLGGNAVLKQLVVVSSSNALYSDSVTIPENIENINVEFYKSDGIAYIDQVVFHLSSSSGGVSPVEDIPQRDSQDFMLNTFRVEDQNLYFKNDDAEYFHVSLFNMQGIKVFSSSTRGNNLLLPHLLSGIYILKVSSVYVNGVRKIYIR